MPGTVCAARRYLDLGQYSSWDEEKRIAWLENELNGKRPLIPATMSMTPEVGLYPESHYNTRGRGAATAQTATGHCALVDCAARSSTDQTTIVICGRYMLDWCLGTGGWPFGAQARDPGLSCEGKGL